MIIRLNNNGACFIAEQVIKGRVRYCHHSVVRFLPDVNMGAKRALYGKKCVPRIFEQI